MQLRMRGPPPTPIAVPRGGCCAPHCVLAAPRAAVCSAIPRPAARGPSVAPWLICFFLRARCGHIYCRAVRHPLSLLPFASSFSCHTRQRPPAADCGGGSAAAGCSSMGDSALAHCNASSQQGCVVEGCVHPAEVSGCPRLQLQRVALAARHWRERKMRAAPMFRTCFNCF